MLNKGNAKAIYSQQELLKSFKRLLTSSTFQEITVNEIAQGANLSRNTFYRNFKSKQDVLMLEIDTIIQDYIHKHEHLKQVNVVTIAPILFETMIQHIDFMTILAKQGLVYLFTDKLMPHLIKTYQDEHQDVLGQLDEDVLLLTFQFTFGGFERLLTQLILADEHPDLKEWQDKFTQVLETMQLLTGSAGQS